MTQDISYEIILNRMLARVPDDIDKREGSVIYDALAPSAYELMLFYIELETAVNETFADTATRDYLVRRASERGLAPFSATYAVLEGVFDTEVPIGAVFAREALNYRVTEKISDTVYRLQCLNVGSVGNSNLGNIIPIEYIEGLTVAKLTKVLIPAEDEEDTENFRTRYFASFKSQAFGGNRADYLEKTTSIDGVGGCKVYPTWNGGGTVKLVVLDSNYNKPNSELLAMVQEEIDPVSGSGLGIAPIGHSVTVIGATEKTISVSSSFVFAQGQSFASSQTAIEAAIDEYFHELRTAWQNEDMLIVRVSQIETRLLALSQVLDISNTKILGGTQNITLQSEEIPIRGVVTNDS